MKKHRYSIMAFILTLFFSQSTLLVGEQTEQQEHERALPIEEFINLATKNDTEFETILIDELTLKYEKNLQLPAKDLVLEVKAQYDLMLTQEREAPNITVGLSKLFPYSGTEITAEYTHAPKFSSMDNSSNFTVEVLQPIAQNAFGRSTRLLDKIVGIEVDVARHQIIEAYEDYMAAIITAYYDWYEAYENLKVGESSYNENLKLLSNIEERRKSRIALPLDVNKTKILVLAKKEKLVDLQEKHEKALNLVKKATRIEDDTILIPQEPHLYEEIDISFKEDYEKFNKTSRTYEILDLLEKKSSLEVEREADDLLPSINLIAGYSVQGRDFDIEYEEDKAFGGISLEWPFPDQVDRAEYETSKITLDKTLLSTVNTHFKLYTDIKNISQEIKREKDLRGIAEEKIDLARSILEDETENYTFGKVTLNDYIDAVNLLDTNLFSKVLHDAKYSKLIVEWLRLTDRLVDKEEARIRK